MSILILILVLGAVGLVIYMVFTSDVNSARLDTFDAEEASPSAGIMDNNAMPILQQQVSALREELTNSRERIQSLTAELDAAKAGEKGQDKGADSSLEDLAADLADAKSQLIEKDRQLDKAYNENLSLKKDIDAYHHKLIDIKEENNKMTVIVNELKRQLAGEPKNGSGAQTGGLSQTDTSSLDAKLRGKSRVVTELKPIQPDGQAKEINRDADKLGKGADIPIAQAELEKLKSAREKQQSGEGAGEEKEPLGGDIAQGRENKTS